jgi:hypothetical protein
MHMIASRVTEDVCWALTEHRQPDPAASARRLSELPGDWPPPERARSTRFRSAAPYHGNMRTPAVRAGSSRTVRLAAGLAAAGVVCFAVGLVIPYLIADHSSSDSSPSSLMALGLGSAGILLLLLSALLFTGHGLGLLWRYIRRPPRGG